MQVCRFRVATVLWFAMIGGIAQARPVASALHVGLAQCARYVQADDFASCYHTARQLASTRDGARSPDAVLTLGVCGEVSAQDLDDIDERVGRMIDAYLAYERYFQRELRPQYRERRDEVPAHMVALKARIAQFDSGEASILLDPPGAPSEPQLAAAGIRLVVHEPEPRETSLARQVTPDAQTAGSGPPAVVPQHVPTPPAPSEQSSSSTPPTVNADQSGIVADRLRCFLREGMAKTELAQDGGQWVERTRFPHISTRCPPLR